MDDEVTKRKQRTIFWLKVLIVFLVVMTIGSAVERDTFHLLYNAVFGGLVGFMYCGQLGMKPLIGFIAGALPAVILLIIIKLI